jgi:hypothetical protein
MFSLIDLIEKMMEPNPERRPEIREILEHPWCRGFLLKRKIINGF